jgi:hypothetical protein
MIERKHAKWRLFFVSIGKGNQSHHQIIRLDRPLFKFGVEIFPPGKTLPPKIFAPVSAKIILCRKINKDSSFLTFDHNFFNGK